MPWLLDGTGLDDGATFGEFVGGFGMEIDARTPVLAAGDEGRRARSRTCSGRGSTREMTYYETAAGARVFSAGVLDFPAVLLHPAGMHLMDNLWRHMLAGPDDEPEPEPETGSLTGYAGSPLRNATARNGSVASSWQAPTSTNTGRASTTRSAARQRRSRSAPRASRS